MVEKSLWRRIYDNRLYYLFVLPAVLMVLIFRYIPFMDATIESLFKWNGANVNEFIGIKNYTRLAVDPVFWTSMKNVTVYTIFTVVVSLIFPFITALIIVSIKKVRVQNFFKLGFIVPMVVPMMVIILLWKWMLGGEYGIFNQLLRVVGLTNLVTPWFSNPQTALMSIAFVNFPWIAGLPFLLFLSGLQNIPDEVYESAKIDGFTPIKKVRYIQIPMCIGQFKLVSMYTLITALQLFEAPMILTNGGPGRTTITPALYLYQRAFEYNEFGYSSAIGVVLMVVILGITIINKVAVKEND